MANIGKVSQVIGPVVDVSFVGEGSTIPAILDGLLITKANGQKVILEVQQHLGEDRVEPAASGAAAAAGLAREAPAMRLWPATACERVRQAHAF